MLSLSQLADIRAAYEARLRALRSLLDAAPSEVDLHERLDIRLAIADCVTAGQVLEEYLRSLIVAPRRKS